MEKEITVLKERIKLLENENLLLKKEQIEISKAKELYLKIFEDFPALIWRSRLDKLCDYFNKTWFEFTGRTFDQEFGYGWAERVHPDDFDFCVETYVTAFEKREAFLMEYRMKNKYDEYRWIRDFGRPFYDLDNSFLGYIGSCYDITVIKDNESRLIELNATKDKFFSIIAHDLKTPFNSIIGFSEYLTEEVKNQNFQNLDVIAGDILKSSYKAMDLLTNLMTWSQLESGRMPFNPKSLDISILVNEVLSIMEPSAKRKNVMIENRMLLNSIAVADKEMIAAVLRNLISNAIKFTQNGGEITVLSSIHEDKIDITISDNGVGISKERMDKLFKIGTNDSTPGTEKEKGTGLGLILCKEFMDKNSGTIRVESIPGSGTSFHISLPTTHLK